MPHLKQGEFHSHRIIQLVSYIRTLIEEGTLRRGGKIPSERECTQALKMSRTSFRMGIGCLVAMGMVKVRPGIGIFLADGPPQLGELQFGVMNALYGLRFSQIYEAWSIVESHLAELAAERASDEHHTAMAEEVAEMYAAAESPLDYLNHNMRFHRTIGAASGNPILAALVETLTSFLYLEFQKTVEQNHNLREAAGVHKEIYKAIRRRQPLEARRAMERHLRLSTTTEELDLTAS